MKIDINRISHQLAADPTITDYDFWRALKQVNYDLETAERSRRPIPIDKLRVRVIIRKAMAKRTKT